MSSDQWFLFLIFFLAGVSQLPLIQDSAVIPEDRDVAEERKRVLECQPMLESMVSSPLILQQLSKVRKKFELVFFSLLVSVWGHMTVQNLLSLPLRCTPVAKLSWLWTGCLWPWGKESVLAFSASTEQARPPRLRCWRAMRALPLGTPLLMDTASWGTLRKWEQEVRIQVFRSSSEN